MQAVCDIRIFYTGRAAPSMGLRASECGQIAARAERPDFSTGRPGHEPMQFTGVPR